MDIAERLETLRDAAPGCALVAFGDLGARLVLRSSAAVQHPQEYFDQLCAQAEHGFLLQDALSAQITPRPMATAEVFVVTPQETRMYIRSPDAGQDTASDALLCVCDCETTARSLLPPATTLLRDLVGGG